MRKFIGIFICLIGLSIDTMVLSQDKICTMDGNRITAHVMEISDKIISYKKWENPNGPTYKIKRSFVARIEYNNGNIDYYSQTPPIQQEIRQTEPTEYVATQSQAQPVQPQTQPVQMQTQASQPPVALPQQPRQEERVIMHRGKLYFASGRKLNAYEQNIYLGNMFKDYERQQNKYVWGEALVSAGSILVAIGAVAGLVSDDPSAGIGLSVGGLVLDVVAIPLLITSDKKRKEIYQRRAAQGGYVPPTAQLTFGSQHYGIGAALRF